MEPLLDRYEGDPDQREPAVVIIDDATVGYAEPIYVQPLCVTCHGDSLSNELKMKMVGGPPGVRSQPSIRS